MIAKLLRNRFSAKGRRRLRNIAGSTAAIFFRGNLNILGKLYGTDKTGSHSYTPHYIAHFKKLSYKKINLLEIGVGGYDDPHAGGNSLKMWKAYFPFGKIYSIDIYDKTALEEHRIKIFQGSQADKKFLDEVSGEIGLIDIIIDDGSHINEHVIVTFNHLFPRLKKGGIYVIEDTQTSYREKYGGDSIDLNNPKTMMNYFKGLTDSLNKTEVPASSFKTIYADTDISSIHFYHNIIFISK